MVKSLPCSAGEVGSIPGGEIRIPHAWGETRPV